MYTKLPSPPANLRFHLQRDNMRLPVRACLWKKRIYFEPTTLYVRIEGTFYIFIFPTLADFRPGGEELLYVTLLGVRDIV